jgi:hypothetical protein
LVCVSRKRGGVNQVILVDMLKGNREKIGVRSYEKAEKVEPRKVKLCILEARQPTQAVVR